jgi:hypothetical protein
MGFGQRLETTYLIFYNLFLDMIAYGIMNSVDKWINIDSGLGEFCGIWGARCEVISPLAIDYQLLHELGICEILGGLQLSISGVFQINMECISGQAFSDRAGRGLCGGLQYYVKIKFTQFFRGRGEGRFMAALLFWRIQ